MIINSKVLKTSFSFFLVIIILLGIVFRFVNLDNKVYWTDETYTSLRASGYTELELVQYLRDKKIVKSGDLQAYQYSNPDRSYLSVLNSLAAEDPQHSPLYYLISKTWVELFGNTISARRSLSAVASLLSLPLIYWLCIELFKKSSIALTATALMAISPFHLLYAQESRQYSLWTFMIIFASTCLLRSLRKSSNYGWLLYSISLALSLYTFLLSIFLIISHGIYVFAIEGFKISKTFIKYLASTLLGIIIFSPWLYVVLNNVLHINKVTGGSKKLSGLGFYATISKEWLVNLSRLFVDIVGDSGATSNLLSPLTIFLLFIVIACFTVTVYSIYYLFKHTKQNPLKPVIFIFSIIAVNYVLLILPDLAVGDNRSMVSRLFNPAYVGINLSLAYLVSNIFLDSSFTFKSWLDNLKVLALAFFCCMSIISCVVITQSQTSWIKGHGQYNHLVANEINKSSNPLIVSTNFGSASDLLTLSYYLRPNIIILSQPTCYTCSTKFVNNSSEIANQISTMFNEFSDVFILNSEVPSELDSQFNITQVFLPNTRTGKSIGSDLRKLTRK
ncbi:glycosyltransferase family 39 protein [Pseudanabaena sp. FACHB-1998]|uniref:glycosyltransferase family 39 protein n=1 Tax=Pseudanabaena sp. FACHB-1998 TaxID=2692858 RepID=UPI00168055FD|nr:glycosyltransferase family 39 protein [Pseudanabaena sp. FACHB-1998]MBD2176017.1 glycosyltransferase family 39 protein [Pseudanabaena sp. FACHB-1998]